MLIQYGAFVNDKLIVTATSTNPLRTWDKLKEFMFLPSWWKKEQVMRMAKIAECTIEVKKIGLLAQNGSFNA